MIIHNKKEFVYLNIPKTGTQSLDQIFTGIGGKWVRVQNISPGAQSHYRHIPQHAKEYKKIISVRNPYTRMLSMYNFELGRDSVNALGKTFKEYCEWALDLTYNADIHTEDDNIYRYFPCWKYAEPNGWDYVIKTESISNDINNIPFLTDSVKNIPHNNKSQGLTWEQAKTTEIIHIINKWAGKDFELFGYNKL